jgi:inner membrane protein
MRSYTHIAAAMLFYVLFSFLFNFDRFMLGIFFAAWISVFPDILDKLLGKHRGFGHSLLWLVPFSLVGFWDMGVAAAILIGFSSHLLMDIFTVHGCPLLYPIREMNFVSLGKKRRIKTGTNTDKSVFIFLVFLLIPLTIYTTGLGALIPDLVGQNFVFAATSNTADNTTIPQTIRNDVSMTFRLDKATNKNVTVQRVSEKETNILIKELEPGG